MEKSWKVKKDYLIKLIKKVSDENGGDEEEWLKEYVRDMIKKYTDSLDILIWTFESLIRKEAKWVIESEKSICELSGLSMELS